MKKRRFSRSVRFLLFVPILMILLLVAHGAPGQIQAGEKDHFACWASGPLSKGDHKWGEKKDEFVIDQRDLGDVARFNMKLRPELLEDPHNREKSGLFTAERLEGLSVAEQIEFTESLEVYTLFDSVPELVDYAFALDVFDAALCPRELDPLEGDYLRLNPLENPRWITQSRFKAVSTSGVSPWVLRMS